MVNIHVIIIKSIPIVQYSINVFIDVSFSFSVFVSCLRFRVFWNVYTNYIYDYYFIIYVDCLCMIRNIPILDIVN